jgi:hypothetical protein
MWEGGVMNARTIVICLSIILPLLSAGCKNTMEKQSQMEKQSPMEKQDQVEYPDFEVKALQISAYSPQGSVWTHWDLSLNVKTTEELLEYLVENETPVEIPVLFTLQYDDNRPVDCASVYRNNAGLDKQIWLPVPTDGEYQYTLENVFQFIDTMAPVCQPSAINVHFDLLKANWKGTVEESDESNNTLTVKTGGWPTEHVWVEETE